MLNVAKSVHTFNKCLISSLSCQVSCCSSNPSILKPKMKKKNKKQPVRNSCSKQNRFSNRSLESNLQSGKCYHLYSMQIPCHKTDHNVPTALTLHKQSSITSTGNYNFSQPRKKDTNDTPPSQLLFVWCWFRVKLDTYNIADS